MEEHAFHQLIKILETEIQKVQSLQDSISKEEYNKKLEGLNFCISYAMELFEEEDIPKTLQKLPSLGNKGTIGAAVKKFNKALEEVKKMLKELKVCKIQYLKIK